MTDKEKQLAFESKIRELYNSGDGRGAIEEATPSSIPLMSQNDPGCRVFVIRYL